VLPKSTRTQILRAVRKGQTVPEAASAAGLTQQTVWGRTRVDAQWRADLDKALMAGRPSAPHGRPTGYRHYACRCPECRTAHHRAKGKRLPHQDTKMPPSS